MSIGQTGENQRQPLAVIARTVRGKGISFLEDRQDAWLCQLIKDEFKKACDEIRGSAPARRASQKVRRSANAE